MAIRWQNTIHAAILALSIGAPWVPGSLVAQTSTPRPGQPIRLGSEPADIPSNLASALNSSDPDSHELESRALWRVSHHTFFLEEVPTGVLEEVPSGVLEEVPSGVLEEVPSGSHASADPVASENAEPEKAEPENGGGRLSNTSPLKPASEVDDASFEDEPHEVRTDVNQTSGHLAPVPLQQATEINTAQLGQGLIQADHSANSGHPTDPSAHRDALVIPPSPVSAARPMILFQPAVPTRSATGQSILRPTVQLVDNPQVEILPTPAMPSHIPPMIPNVSDDGRIPLMGESELQSIWVEDAQPSIALPSRKLKKLAASFWSNRRRPIINMLHRVESAIASQAGYDIGVGRERLPFAMFEMDSSQPLNNFRIRFDSAYDWEFPDRAEYFWSKAGGKGPDAIEPSVDYQDIRFLMEVGGPRFSVGTEVPLRFLDPTVVGNVGGLSDVVLTTKTMLLDGDNWQLTQVLRTQMATGSSKSGRGNGHASMEPGMIARYKWSEDTFVHSELKLWFPMGGDPEFSGEVLRYGFGFANVFYDSDTFAVIPTLEFVAWSVLSGRKSALGYGTDGANVDGENILNLYPGVRFVRDDACDFGLFELGLSGGVSVTERHWYRGLLRLDLRWSF